MIPVEEKYVIIRKGTNTNAPKTNLKKYIKSLENEGYAIYDYRKHIIIEEE